VYVCFLISWYFQAHINPKSFSPLFLSAFN
jgi:hypothetical protein